MGNWAMGEVLGFDFETTGVDRFNDVPVSFALVTVGPGIWSRRRRVWWIPDERFRPEPWRCTE